MEIQKSLINNLQINEMRIFYIAQKIFNSTIKFTYKLVD